MFDAPYRCLSLALLALLATPPAAAACTEAHMLVSSGNVMNDDSCLQYCKAPTPNLSTKADALFWALGSGDPEFGAGNDSGAFSGRKLFHGRPPLNYGNGTFYNYERGFNTNWGASYLVDGCVVQAGQDACTCLLLVDESQEQGYFAMLSAKANATLDFWFSAKPRLGRIPTPEVASNRSKGGKLTVGLSVPAPTRASVPGPNGGCQCGPQGFRISSRSAAAGTSASRRRQNWRPAGDTVHPFGETVELTFDCPAEGQELYLSALLRFADGFDSPVVGAEAGPFSCR